MVILKKENNILNTIINSEELSNGNVKLSVAVNEIQLETEAFGANYHDALWNLYYKLEEIGFQLICNGVSLNVYPSALQFDMGLAYQGNLLKMGLKNNDSLVLIELNIADFRRCNKIDQISFYNKWVLSKKKDNLKHQEIFIDSVQKESQFIFFWGHQSSNYEITKSCFSQWWPCKFIFEGITYSSTEQWMMAEKARIFSDREILEDILQTNDPKLIKELGRRIAFFDEEVWNIRKYDVVYEGNYLKFSQNESLKSYLLSTGNKVIVEASPYDNVWGIGMKQQDEGISDPKNWKGENLLGFVLMEVRKALL